MNIFVLHADPARCAAFHCDTHVISQTKETAQLLCFALERLGLWDDMECDLYSPEGSHINHPCSVWAAESPQNFEWLSMLGFFLNCEYVRRSKAGAWPTQAKIKRGSDHASVEIVMNALRVFRRRRKTRSELLHMTAWPQAMPRTYQRAVSDEPVSARVGDSHPSIQAYRDYYRGGKARLKGKDATWTSRDVPSWWSTQPPYSGLEDPLFEPDPLEDL